MNDFFIKEINALYGKNKKRNSLRILSTCHLSSKLLLNNSAIFNDKWISIH